MKPWPREPKTTDYCRACGESPESGSHLPQGHAYVAPWDKLPWGTLDFRWKNTPFERLSDRQHSVCRLLCQGWTCKEIGRNLGINTKTVDSHRLAVMDKTMVQNVVHLLRLAIAWGYVDVPTRGMEDGK